MVVDDEPAIIELFTELFSPAGIRVVGAESAEEAIEIDKQEDIKVYFFDMRLPNMDGIELLKQIKWAKPAAVYYAITGYATVYDLIKCREAGFDDYFPKPFKLEELKKAVEGAFEKVGRWRSS